MLDLTKHRELKQSGSSKHSSTRSDAQSGPMPLKVFWRYVKCYEQSNIEATET